jgi:transposase
MTLHPQPLPPVPDATAAAVEAALPKGNLYVDLRAEFGTLYNDQRFADLYPARGRPVAVAPWRLALVLVMQSIEGLTDRPAADAVRRWMDWKFALSLELTDPGFDHTLLHDVRERLLVSGREHQLLDTLLTACKARGLIKPRGTQRTDSTHVLAAIRTLHRLECVLEAMRLVLNRLAVADPAWLQTWVPGDWYERYGARAENARLPKELSKRQALAEAIGRDGYQRLERLAAADSPPHRRGLPAADVLRRIWIQQYYRSTIPGAETLRWRTAEEGPPSAGLIHSPYDSEARFSSKRATHWVGYTVHISETCDHDRPDLITQVLTTEAATQDSVLGPTIQQDLAQRDLLPGTHLLDSGSGDSELFVSARMEHGVDVVGPPFGSYSRPRLAGAGSDLHAFVIDWDQEQATCPQGQTSVKWTPGVNINGDPGVRIRFDKATCRACAVRSACTWAKDAPRQLTVRTKEHHLALQTARQRQETDAFKAQSAMRAGSASGISQGTRRFTMRQSRYIGLARTHFQQILVAVAMNLVRVVAWLWNESLGDRKRSAGRFAVLMPQVQPVMDSPC